MLLLWHPPTPRRLRLWVDCLVDVTAAAGHREIATPARFTHPARARSRLQYSPVLSDRSNAPPGPRGLAAIAAPITHAGAGGNSGEEAQITRQRVPAREIWLHLPGCVQRLKCIDVPEAKGFRRELWHQILAMAKRDEVRPSPLKAVTKALSPTRGEAKVQTLSGSAAYSFLRFRERQGRPRPSRDCGQ